MAAAFSAWTVFCDVDGVVADIHRPLCRIHGWDYDKWPKGEYYIEKAFGVSAAQIWEHPEVVGPRFWADAPKTPWADALIERLVAIFGHQHVVFATQPVRDPGCAAGKVEWLARHYPKHRFFIGSPKRYLAGPGRLLIDDSEANERDFFEGGGIGVLFPRVWNRLHPFEGRPVGHVEAAIYAATGL
jgi:hypothetical protein